MDSNYQSFINTQKIIDYLKKLLGDKTEVYYPVIYRMIVTIQTEKDIDLFVNFCAELYKSGFEKSVVEHALKLKELGLKSDIKNLDG